jgi:peptidyl-tRNA hydrolase, PTH1 family
MVMSGKLIVGLGNIGSKYDLTRHNVGFMLLDKMATSWQNKFNGSFATSNSNYLLKPATFMNRSGISVSAASTFYKVPSESVIVVHDDIDLAFGKLKIKQGGGNGGHNGLVSVSSHISNDYFRLRIGVGRPLFGDAADFVLGKFTSEELSAIDMLLDKIVANFELFDNPSVFLQKCME